MCLLVFLAQRNCCTSNDIVVENMFVPQERVLGLTNLVAGNGLGRALHGSAVYASPMAPVLLIAAASPTIGQARSVLRRFREKTVERTRAISPTSEKQRSSIHARLGEASQEIHEAELLIRDVVADAMRLRGDASTEERSRWALGFTRAVHGARRATQRLADASGSSVHFQKNPVQRAVRDANTATSHIAFDWDARHELLGRVQLGLDADGFLF